MRSKARIPNSSSDNAALACRQTISSRNEQETLTDLSRDHRAVRKFLPPLGDNYLLQVMADTANSRK